MRVSLVLMILLLTACAPADNASPAATSPAREPTSEPLPAAIATLASDEPPPGFASAEFKTDFSKHSVSFSDILSGGPPKDGIPPIDSPQFVTVADADEWLKPVEPVIFVQVGDDARAYPLQILTWHEIVNDTVGDVPLTVTFCPLCNTAIVFERTLDDRVLDFGTTGRLRYSNLIMYDRQTETWWQQATGEAIVGELTGARLTFYPATLIAWADFKAQHPAGKVLSRETGFSRNYGVNPYVGYDDVNTPPFLYRGPDTPGRLPPVARVLAVELNGDTVAYPYDVLQQWRVLNDRAGGENIVVFWQPGTASALDSASLASGRDVGAASAFLSEVDGEPLTLRYVEGKFVDDETGSEWNAFGQAVSGELAGAQLEPVVAVNHFWFSWAAFKP
ncbi:MAG: DUF3179 domain-containing protein, partial [Anaerolineales bacterium]